MVEYLRQHQNLILSIVKKGCGSKVVELTKKHGAEGGTIIMGEGVGHAGHGWFMGLQYDNEREIVMSLIPQNNVKAALSSLVDNLELNKPYSGISLSIDVINVVGAVHLLERQKSKTQKSSVKPAMSQKKEVDFNLIVSIVPKGKCDVIVDASRQAGAEGGTVITGRGTGIHEKAKLFSIPIEPEKDIVLTMVPMEKTDNVLESIVEKAELDKPGTGIAFILPVEQTAGIHHNVST